jgi:hypothetical protein
VTATTDDDKCRAIDAALSGWRQGDCVVGNQWFVHRIAPEAPLSQEAITAAEQGVDLAEVETLGFTVLSQTCDIVRSCSERPYLEIAPLVRVGDSHLQDIQRGRRPRYAFIPALSSEGLVADLDRVMTVEKSVAATWTRAPGCTSDDEARSFGQALARKRTRWAFPDDFVQLARNLQSRLQDKHRKQSDEGAALRALQQIRVRAAPSWEADSIELMFWFIRHEEVPNFNGRNWHELLHSWLALTPKGGRYSLVNGSVVTLDQMTARDYIESDPLDLDHLSSGSV